MNPFTHTPDSFDLLCAEASQDAYTLAGSSEPGCPLQQVIQSDSAHCIIRMAGGVIIIAFRGTANVRDWLTDAEAHRVMVSDGVGHVHAGFKNAWASIAAQVLAAIPATNISKVFITGHSLGGALAVLCARSFALNKMPFERLVTFGQPRVFDAPGASLCDKLFGDRHIRYTNASDLIPWIPWLMATYKHSGNELYFPPVIDHCIVNPSTLRKLIDNGPELYFDWRDRKLALIIDHFIAKYIPRLRSVIPAPSAPPREASPTGGVS